MIDFKRTCRTCMKTENDVTLINLFSSMKIEGSWFIKLTDLVKETIMLQITEGDDLPQNLCDACVKNLQTIYTFRNQALNAEKELRKIVSQNLQIKKETDYCLKHEDELEYLDQSCDDFIFDSQPPKLEDEPSMFICNVDDDPSIFICNALLENPVTDLEVKVKEEYVKDQYKCTECNLAFENQESLLLHFKEHQGVGAESSRNYSNGRRLKQHVTIHKDKCKSSTELLKVKSMPAPYECSECHIVFEKRRSLASHLKKHKIKMNLDSQGTYYCGYCNKSFALKTRLRRHIKLHSEARPFRCIKCSKSYTRKDQLTMHMSKHNGSKRYSCSICIKAFSQLCSLKDHERTHTGETPFLCSECGKGFRNNSNLRQHLRRHTGLKPFSCNLCPKTFCTKGQMKSHMDTHTGAHPYKCNECGAAFTKSNSLKKHSYIHLGIKQFACDNCSMRFSSKDHLKRHQRIHTGEKPYRCPHCARAFTQSNDLVKHVRTHLGQNIYQCTVCQAKFRLMRELKRHYPVHYMNGAASVPAQGVEAPLVLLKGCSDQGAEAGGGADVPTDRQITITFNSNVLDKNSIGDITINIEPGKITN